MKPGIYSYGPHIDSLIWVDSVGEVINGGYYVEFVDRGKRVMLKGEDGEAALYADRMCDVPTPEECPERDYNSVINFAWEKMQRG
jgi:hypothetical protein